MDFRVSCLKWPRPYPAIFPRRVFYLAVSVGDFKLTGRDIWESGILADWNR